MLAGVKLRDLHMRAFLDFVEAVIIEPAVNGGQDIDTVLDGIDKNIREANAQWFIAQGRGEEVFDTPEWQRRAQFVETSMPAEFEMGDPGSKYARPAGSGEQMRVEEIDVDLDLSDIEVPDRDAFR